MLEAKNLFKEYKTKNGPVVKALDDVSIRFEETGMVFILGKSGSGKSTLLNVLGGLDKYDFGEVIVKGKSSKDFKQADFDSYRNTFIGFIFQDYNILEEFTISKNIGLALELQGKKADKKAIEDLMEQVDLKGFGKRKPNTLSGGQRQRVAIARALVKNPEIIMADEPTGALDSNTGKQVLDTLKKLSKTKLVLIVSHDREFAEYYGDRIIELSDGKIISDVVKYKSAPKESNGLDIVDDKILTIKKGVKLDTAKSKTLKEFIDQHENEEIIISVDSKANKEFKKFAMIDDDGNKESFKNTDNLNVKEYDGSKFKMIRSKLPGKDSFKMGASGLKAKPIRLFFTIILSAIAFGLFGLADTMGSYDKTDNTIVSMRDSRINYASFRKQIKESEDSDWYMGSTLSEADFSYLNTELKGLEFYPVFNISDSMSEYYFQDSLYNSDGMSDYDSLYRSSLYGFIELNENNVSNIGNMLVGRIPNADDEIVITKYTYEVFAKAEYKDNSNSEIKIEALEDVIGKKMRSYYGSGKEFTIVGVIDTNCDLTRYLRMEEEHFGQSASDYMLSSEFSDYIRTSYHALGYLNKDFYKNNLADKGAFDIISNNSGGISATIADSSSDSWGYSYEYIAPYSTDLNDTIYYFDSNKQGLLDNEVVVTYSAFTYLELDVNGTKKRFDEITNSYCKSESFSQQYNTLLERLGLSEYYNEIIYYHGGFNTDTFIYDEQATLWKYENWYYHYLVEITDAQKTEIDNFFKNFDVPGCVDVRQYFQLSSVKTKLEELYNSRLATDADIGTFDSYVQTLYTRVQSVDYWPSQYLTTITTEEQKIVNDARGYIIEKLAPHLPKKFFARYGKDLQTPKEFNIVGVYTDYVSSEDMWRNGVVSNYLYTELKDSIGGIYNFAIAPLDYQNAELLTSVVNFNYGLEGENVKYSLNNPVMTSINEINNMIETLSEIFLYVGIGFAVFASLLLLNFITISISYKKREIGVLRAIGARGMDVFKIFFNEAFIIAFINFLLASVGSVIVCEIINNVIRTDYGMLITILNIGIRQFVLMFAVSLLVAFLSSFLPVRSIARKKPIDAIRNS